MMSWNDAAKECKHLGGHLPLVKRYYSISNVFNKFSYAFYMTSNEGEGFGHLTYLGLTRKASTLKYYDY